MVTHGIVVSTHSRAKAAAVIRSILQILGKSFNTQPREGGCVHGGGGEVNIVSVSTHSRAKAAAFPSCFIFFNKKFQHTAARRRLLKDFLD